MKDLSFTLEAGETLAIVGYNGSGTLTYHMSIASYNRLTFLPTLGKSTLAHVLLRILEFDKGELLINGVNIRQLSPVELHTRVSAVFQGFSKFDASAQENIGFGHFQELQNDAAIEHAARLAGADALLHSLPMGMRTTLGASEHDLSVHHMVGARAASSVSESHHDLSGGEVRKTTA